MAENPNYEKLKQKLKKMEKEAVKGKQAQKMLKQKITELDSFINNIPDMAWIKDANSRFVAVNRAFGEAVGMDHVSLIHQTCEICFGKEGAKKFREDDLEVMKGRRQKVIEEKIIDSQNNGIWLETVKSPILDHSGKAIGTVGISRDITERKRAEETLRQAHNELERIVNERTANLAQANEQLRLEIEERKRAEKKASYEQGLLQMLLDNIPDYVYFKDKNRRFVRASNFFCDLFKCSLEDIIGKKDEDLFPKEIAEETASDDRHVIETGIPLVNKEEGGESIGGEEHWVLTTKLPWYDRKGNIIGLFGISREITDRKKAEEALRKSSELFEKTFISQRDAIFILNPDVPPKITDCNPAAVKTFGYTRQEMLGRSIAFLHVNEATMKKFQENLYPTVEDCGYYYLSEFEMKRKDGTVFPTEHSVFFLQNDQGIRIGWVSVVRDITERKKAEKALRESEERFRDMAENISEVFWLFDCIEQKVIYVNPAYETIWCRSVEDLYNNYDEWAESIYPDDITYAQESFANIAETGGGETREYRIVRPDGSVRWISDKGFAITDKDGKVCRITGIAEDITERMRAEEALRKSGERYALATKAARVGVWDWNIQTNEFYLDPNVKAILGYSDAEIPNDIEVWSNYVHPDDKQPVMEAFQDHIDGKTPEFAYEHRMLHKDGSIRWIMARGTAIRDDQGNPVRVVGTDTDITQRKQAEEALLESERKFRNLAEQSPNMIFIIKSSKVVYANRKCEEITGYKRDELHSADFDFFRLIAPEGVKLIKKNFKKHMSGEEVKPYEYTLIRKSDKRIEVIITTKLINYEGENAILGILTDITERKNAEKALREKDNKLERQAKNLIEMNTALKVLLEQREKEKTNIKESLLADIKKLVYPYVEKLENKGLNEDAQTFVNIIKSNINDLISPLASNLSSKYFSLTPSEIQIADLIKHGKTSKEIASMLNVSPKAVSFHRGNLRKKLGLLNKKINLRTYLQNFPH
jgi:PAS domain S-box-containing protein